jgi:hypothetical protein
VLRFLENVMLAYLLALAVGFGSFSLYLAAFFFPEVHRKYDLAWSGVGMFYALVLWVCAGRITGGVLLGQVASVSLIGWFGWQTLKLRRTQTPIDLQTQLPPEATSSSEVVQLTAKQLRQDLRQSANTSSLLANLNRFVDLVAALITAVQSWISAFVSTTLSTQTGTVQGSGAQTRSTPDPSPSPPATAPKTPIASPVNETPPVTSSPSSQITPPSIEITTVRIEVDGLEGGLDNRLDKNGTKDDRLNSGVKSNSSEIAQSLYEEPDAEWDELEIEDDPDMDTIDGALLDGMGSMTEPSMMPEGWRHRSNPTEPKRD